MESSQGLLILFEKDLLVLAEQVVYKYLPERTVVVRKTLHSVMQVLRNQDLQYSLLLIPPLRENLLTVLLTVLLTMPLPLLLATLLLATLLLTAPLTVLLTGPQQTLQQEQRGPILMADQIHQYLQNRMNFHQIVADVSQTRTGYK
jgi:hypothetical protein